MLKRLCVFCGSCPGNRPEYAAAAREMGRALAEAGIGLVYGGGGVGLMGQTAQAALTHGGSVIGVIPRALQRKRLGLKGLADLRIVGSMHERKALMAKLSDGYIALPGSIGTLDEFFEALTWAQLGIHHKPCGILNVSGYYDAILKFLDLTVSQGFMQPETRAMVLVDASPKRLLKKFARYKAPRLDKAAWALDLHSRES